MQIIIDSNILFSALIKDSLNRKLILKYEGYFLFPSFIFEEIEEHKQELLDKSGMNEEEFDNLLNIILKKVVIVPCEILLPFREKAFELVKNIDEDDVLFVACALAYPNSIIWSDDKHFKKIRDIKVINTKEIIKIIEKNV